jgi:hypothetical protein
MTGVIATIPKFQFSNATGTPLANGTLTVYLAGTTTLTNTWQDYALTSLNTNPVILDSRGECVLWLDSATNYKFVLKNSSGVVQWTLDNVSGAASAPSLTAAFASFSASLASSSGSSQVGFLQSGTGAITRTLESKERDAVSVKDFGAVGDGIANDTSAIQLALNSAKFVYIPAGTYLLTASLNVQSNTTIIGQGASSILKAGANLVYGLSAINVSNINISDLAFNGGGQTTNVATGFANAIGIFAQGVNRLRINRVSITKCGISDGTTNDGTLGGWGIFVGPSSIQSTKDVVIDGCSITYIAGCGMNRGDGIIINGTYVGATGFTSSDVVITNNYIAFCGRHCATVSASFDLPFNVKITNNSFYNAALCGIDFESGTNCIVDNNYFKSCGNDQTYCNPSSLYGVTFNLMAGIALASANCTLIRLLNNSLEGCYYGFSLGAGDGFTLNNNIIRTSIKQDLYQGEAQSPINLTMIGNRFLTNSGTIQFFRSLTNTGDYRFQNNTFTTKLQILGISRAVISQNTIFNGIEIGFANTKDVSIIGNIIKTSSGNGIYFISTGQLSKGIIITGNNFEGDFTMSNGIQFTDASVYDAIVNENHFIQILNDGVRSDTGSSKLNVSNNMFDGMTIAIDIQRGDSKDSIYSNNIFANCSLYCLRFNDIGTGFSMLRNLIQGNLSTDSCVNGLYIGIAGGTYDYNIISLNNFHSCTGAKFTVGSGNANGIIINNITT